MTNQDIAMGAMAFLDPTTPHLEESLLGLLARAVARNSIGSIGLPLTMNGMSVRASDVLQAVGVDAEKLATIVGCSLSEIESRAIRRRVELSDKHSVRGTILVDWGNCKIPLYNLETKYRYISPTTFRAEPFHRQAWLLRSLPYCPVSYELLVKDCVHCNAQQRWRSSRGVGNCDVCGKLIEPTKEPLLPFELREGYNIIAGLSSHNPAIATETKNRLSPALRGDAPPDLVQTAFVLGRFLAKGGGHDLSARYAAQKDKRLWARCLAKGAEALLDWPTAFKASLSEGFERHARTLGGIPRVTGKLVNRQEAGIGPAAIIRRDMPELCNSRRKSPAAIVAPIMPIGEFLRRAKLTGRQFKKLKTGIAFEGLEITGTSRKTIELHPELGEAIIAEKIESTPIESVAHRLGLPSYAIEQLVCDSQLQTRYHPIFFELGLSARIDKESVRTLLTDIEDNACGLVRKPCSSLGAAGKLMQRFGGEKPWSRLFALLSDGTIDYRITALPLDGMKARLPTSLMIDKRRFEVLTPLLGESLVPSRRRLVHYYSQDDVMEVLGLNHKRIKTAEATGALTPTGERRRAILYDRDPVLALSREYAGISEVAQRLGEPFATGQRLANLIRQAGLKEHSCGWLRSELDKRSRSNPHQCSEN